jgi:amphi-Trp domain-containing protein
MDIFEIKQKETVSREEVAERLRVLADMLARHNDLEFNRGGMHFTVHVPDELQLKVARGGDRRARARDRAEVVIAGAARSSAKSDGGLPGATAQAAS